MNPKMRTKKKYAAKRIGQTLVFPAGKMIEPAELLIHLQAVAAQVASLQRAAKRMSRRPYTRTLPAQRSLAEMTSEEWEADQKRQKAILAGLIAEAQARIPGPLDSPARQSYRNSPIDEIIVEKFRRQGFDL